MLLFTVPVTSNASRHFKSPLAMGEMPFKIKRASSVPISVVIDTGVNSNNRIQQNLHKLKNGDTAELTDLTGRTITYQVIDKQVVEPTDRSCTSQLWQLQNGIREMTLITCTNHGKQRLAVRLREVK